MPAWLDRYKDEIRNSPSYGVAGALATLAGHLVLVYFTNPPWLTTPVLIALTVFAIVLGAVTGFSVRLGIIFFLAWGEELIARSESQSS